ncbi:MAG: hypothetical protein AB1483_02860 [Candidatus Zixiibacteriota bacterium]
MNRTLATSILCGFITLIIVISISIGCSDDVIVEPPASLIGDYEGKYIYTLDLGATTERTLDPWSIRWRFSNSQYWLYDENDENYCICQPSGDYTLADGVELIMKEDGCAGCVFDSLKIPQGAFSLRQPGDSIIMTQIIGDVQKEIILWPATE